MSLKPLEVAKLAWEGASEKKALDPVILKMENLTIVADYFLIASGRTQLAVKAIADGVVEKLAAAQIHPRGQEGEEDHNWVLLDYGTVVVHIFSEQAREFYNLERLWRDAPKVEMDDAVRDTGADL